MTSARCLAAVMLVGSAALARPVHSLQPPTPKSIRERLEAGLALQAGDNLLRFGREGTVEGSGGAGARGAGHFSVKGSRVEAFGQGTMACMGDESSCAGVEGLDWSFRIAFTVIAVGADSLLVRIESDSSTAQLSHALQLVGATTDEGALAVQLIPASATQQLVTEVEKVLKSWEGELAESALLVRGPPAKRPRAVSEVFFGAAGEPAARALAQLLAPLIGEAAVKPWPSPTPFGVLLVIGESKAR